MNGDLLLVGSAPVETAEEMFLSFGRALGNYLPCIPDGEIGERQYWVEALAYRVLHGHPELETLRRPAPDENGVERWRPRGFDDEFQFRVRPGVEKVRFGDPGWRLGYARDAINSYYVFRQLKKEGVLPSHIRFQVSIPLSYSAVTSFFPDPADHSRIVPGFTEAMRAEIRKIVEKIPPSDLAIQWDLAVENRYVEATLLKEGGAAAKKLADILMVPNREISADIPREIALGYHSCFGTLAGWPTRQPRDLTGSVLLMNAANATAGRPVNFFHIPTLGTSRDEFFAPLSELQESQGRVYLGMIHHLNGFNVQEQIITAQKFLPDFGIAAPCGLGRVPDRPGAQIREEHKKVTTNYIDAVIKDHIAAIEILRGLRMK